MIDEKSIEKIAHLARLYLGEGETPEYHKHFVKIMDYFNNLQNINTEGVEPLVTPHNFHEAFRRDEVKQDINSEELLENAPDVKDGLFKVPPVV